LTTALDHSSFASAASPAGPVDAEAAVSIAHERLIACVRALPRRHALILAWQFGFGGSVADATTIAGRLGLPVEQVDHLLEQALAELGCELIAASHRADARQVAA
jgi:hypothetical protein